MGDIALVINDSTSSNNGSYIYNGSGWSTLALYNTIGMLSNLSDVTLSSLSVNQSLKWNGSKWINSTDDDRLAILSDVTLSSVSNNQILQYNSSLSKWVNSTLTTGSSTLSTLTDCSISSPSNDQILVFTTASSLNKWTPYTISGATFNDTTKTITVSGTTSLSGLTTDVIISSPSTNQMLAYNGTKWTNKVF